MWQVKKPSVDVQLQGDNAVSSCPWSHWSQYAGSSWKTFRVQTIKTIRSSTWTATSFAFCYKFNNAKCKDLLSMSAPDRPISYLATLAIACDHGSFLFIWNWARSDELVIQPVALGTHLTRCCFWRKQHLLFFNSLHNHQTNGHKSMEQTPLWSGGENISPLTSCVPYSHKGYQEEMGQGNQLRTNPWMSSMSRIQVLVVFMRQSWHRRDS